MSIFFFKEKVKKIQGVHCDMLESKCIFLGRKIYFLSVKFFSLKSWKINIYEYLKTFYERQKIMSEHWVNKPRTLGAWNRQLSSKGRGNFMDFYCFYLQFWSWTSWSRFHTKKNMSLPLKMASQIPCSGINFWLS